MEHFDKNLFGSLCLRKNLQTWQNLSLSYHVRTIEVITVKSAALENFLSLQL